MALLAGGSLLPVAASAAVAPAEEPAVAVGTASVAGDQGTGKMPVLPTPPVGTNGHGWEPEPVHLINFHSGKCLEIANFWTHNGAPAQQWTCLAGNATQSWWRWHIQGDGSVGWYYLYNANSGKCLEVGGWRLDSGAPIQQWDCHWGANQVWHTYGGVFTGYWNYANQHSAKCLEIGGWRLDDRAPAIQWDCFGNANQIWGRRYF